MRSVIFVAIAAIALSVVVAEEKKIVCYLGSWSAYRNDEGNFQIEDINVTLCTHLIYAFVGLDGDAVAILDKWLDLADHGGKDGFKRFNALRQQNPNVKTLVAIGGWNEGSIKYSQMAANWTARGIFVKNVVDFVKKYEFDGFDVDWEYPTQRYGSPADRSNYVTLLEELSNAFTINNLLLSAAVGAPESLASEAYNIHEISKYLDFINLMTYDFHGPSEKQTGHNTPLYASSTVDKKATVDAAVKYWLSEGCPAKKLILGTATYGRSFNLSSSMFAWVGAPCKGPGIMGPFTKENGILGYNEICAAQKNEDWIVNFDHVARVPYASRGDQWISYDSVRSIKEKAEYVKNMGLGGAMVWSIDTDDFNGNCGEKYPLINMLNKVLRPENVFGNTTPMPTSPPILNVASGNIFGPISILFNFFLIFLFIYS